MRRTHKCRCVRTQTTTPRPNSSRGDSSSSALSQALAGRHAPTTARKRQQAFSPVAEKAAARKQRR
eukprot:11253749-Alexandrium_andersonii.AAC.1